uniref:PH domain-containing protein n=1 Tax=Anopheles farauti TaxID=69004 RepID=A0A182QZ86_9DIPT
MMQSSASSATAASAAAHSTDPAAAGTLDSATMAKTVASGGVNTSSSSTGSTVASANSIGGSSGTGRGSSLVIPESLNVVLHGYQRKLKTNKKKYFVVYGDLPEKFARLEYFDSEKKFKQSFTKNGNGCEGTGAKRSIQLRSCFNINKRHDIKKHIISLYTKDDCFNIFFESEEEMTRWLRTLLRLQRGEDPEGEPTEPKPLFGLVVAFEISSLRIF